MSKAGQYVPGKVLFFIILAYPLGIVSLNVSECDSNGCVFIVGTNVTIKAQIYSIINAKSLTLKGYGKYSIFYREIPDLQPDVCATTSPPCPIVADKTFFYTTVINVPYVMPFTVF